MRLLNCVMLTMALSMSVSPAQETKTKSKPNSPDAFELKMAEFVDRGFYAASATDRATILACSLRATSVLNSEEREEISRTGIDGTTEEQNARYASKYPEMMAGLLACVPTSAAMAMRQVILTVAGQGTFSMVVGGKSTFQQFPRGMIIYDGGELTVAGIQIELPDFERKLVISVAEDNSVSFTVDP